MIFRSLAPGDPPPVQSYLAKHRLVLSAEHAGRAVPKALGDLGVSLADQQRHVWYDIGMDRVPQLVRQQLGCSLVHSVYSRLVLDVNRWPGDPTALPTQSDDVLVPGNQTVRWPERVARHQVFHVRYHAALAELCDTVASFDQNELGGPPIHLSLHSMTDRLASNPQPRPWEVTFLHNEDARLARTLADWFAAKGFTTALNAPYDAQGKTGFTLYSHGAARGWLHCAVELRQDLISTEKGCVTWATQLAKALQAVMANL